jgi:hypothetical protein
MRLTQCVVAGASIGDGGETASGGAGGSKAMPLAGPAFCARVSSLSLKDGFDFTVHDSRGPVNGYSARLVADFCVRKAGAHYGRHQCIKLRCTGLDFVEDSGHTATLLLGTGTLVVRTPAGECFAYDVASNMQREFGDAVKMSREEWQETRPWLALPWHDARIYVGKWHHPPNAYTAIIHEHLMIPEPPSHHSLLCFTCDQPLPFIMRRLLLGVRYLPAEERWRQRAVAVLLALHPRAGEDSLIRVLSPDSFRIIMRLEYSTPRIRGGPGGGSLSPTPDVKATLTLIRAVDRRRRGGGGSGFRRRRKRRQAGASSSSFSR